MRKAGSVYAYRSVFCAESAGSVYAWITWLIHRVCPQPLRALWYALGATEHRDMGTARFQFQAMRNRSHLRVTVHQEHLAELLEEIFLKVAQPLCVLGIARAKLHLQRRP